MKGLVLLPWRRALPVLVVTAAALPLTYAVRWREWMSSWSETQHLLGVGFVLMVPLATGIGAWAGAAHRRQGLDALARAAARSNWSVAVREHAEVVAWAVLGYVLGALPAFVATALTAVNGRPAVLPVASQVACVAGLVTLGWAIGCRFPSLLAAPVVTASGYAVFAFLAIWADDAVLVLTPFEERWMTFHRILWWVMALQVLGWGLVVLHGIARRANRPLLGSVALTAVGLVAVPLLLTTPATRVVVPGEMRLRCASYGPGELCLPHAKEAARRNLAVELRRASTLLAGLLPQGTAFLGDEAGALSADGDRNLTSVEKRLRSSGRRLVLLSAVDDLSTFSWPDTSQLHVGLIMHLVGYAPYDRNAPVPEGLPKVTPTELVWRWYFDATGLPLDGSAVVGGPTLNEDFLDFRGHEDDLRWLEELEPGARERWFHDHAQAMRAGELTWSDFGDRSDH